MRRPPLATRAPTVIAGSGAARINACQDPETATDRANLDARAEIRPQTPILPLAGSGPPADSSPILLAAAFGPESSPRERP